MFKDGDVLFMWNGTSDSYDVAIHVLRDEIFQVNGTQHTVKNAISYKSIMLDVKAKGDKHYSRTIYNGTYLISYVL